jgi:hypothetical protein
VDNASLQKQTMLTYKVKKGRVMIFFISFIFMYLASDWLFGCPNTFHVASCDSECHVQDLKDQQHEVSLSNSNWSGEEEYVSQLGKHSVNQTLKNENESKETIMENVVNDSEADTLGLALENQANVEENNKDDQTTDQTSNETTVEDDVENKLDEKKTLEEKHTKEQEQVQEELKNTLHNTYAKTPVDVQTPEQIQEDVKDFDQNKEVDKTKSQETEMKSSTGEKDSSSPKKTTRRGTVATQKKPVKGRKK